MQQNRQPIQQQEKKQYIYETKIVDRMQPKEVFADCLQKVFQDFSNRGFEYVGESCNLDAPVSVLVFRK